MDKMIQGEKVGGLLFGFLGFFKGALVFQNYFAHPEVNIIFSIHL